MYVVKCLAPVTGSAAEPGSFWQQTRKVSSQLFHAQWLHRLVLVPDHTEWIAITYIQTYK